MRKSLYRPAEVAEVCGVTRRTVYNWIKEGHLPSFKTGPKIVCVERADLEKFMGGRLLPEPPIETARPLLDIKAQVVDSLTVEPRPGQLSLPPEYLPVASENLAEVPAVSASKPASSPSQKSLKKKPRR